MNRFKAFLIILLVLVQFSLNAQQQLLWYNRPAEKWTDAVPIGNGRLGAMIFGGTAQDRLQFNEATLWTGAPRDYNRPGAAAYLPEIRKLLFEGKQKEAEALAQSNFMGVQSEAGDRKKWVREIVGGKGISGNPALSGYDDRKWKTIHVPSYEGWEAVGLANFDGAVWLRTTVEVPKSWMGKDLVLDLNRIRDCDFTYVNGVLVGSTDSTEPRKYTVPARLVKLGKNHIAIQVLNYFDKGGIAGFKDTTRHIGIYPVGTTVKEGISLVKPWKYLVQNSAPPAVAQYQGSYQRFGDVYLKFGHSTVSNYKRSLDLRTAIAKTTYTANGINFTRTYFASAPHQAIVVHLTADKLKSVSFTASLGSPHQHAQIRMLNSRTISLEVQVKDGALKGEGRLTAIVKNGSCRLVNGKIVIDKADEATLYLTAGTNFLSDSDVSGNPASANVDALAKLKNKSYVQVEREHIQDYQQHYNTFDIDLGETPAGQLPTNERIEKFVTGRDPALIALYVQYGRYLLISSSRPGGQPANLQGIWNDLLTPPWGSKYTTNINLEMNYWPAEVLNLASLHQPLFDKINALMIKGRETAKTYYHARGWVLHHNTDLWNGTAPINASNHGIWVTGAAWLCQHLWEHYLFTKDTSFLKKAYPVMKEAALFFDDFLVRDPKSGWLISSPSNSPENGGLVAGPTMDHQLIRSLFYNCIAAANVLSVDDVLKKRLAEKAKSIAPNQIGRYGQLQEWLEDKDDTTNKHRHVSHLWGVYPGSDISWDKSPQFMQAAKQSLLYRGDEATGWSLAWKINYWARFKDGDHALKMIKMLLSPATANGAGSYVNLFDAHPPFQIDGNFGGAAGIAEMLVQSHEKYIEILPALPKELLFGEVKGICARGAFELGMKWTDGKLASLNILSKAGGKCIIRYKNQVVSLETKPGARYELNDQLKLNVP